MLVEARAAAREVLREGEEISGNLRELGDALRTNAERLLRDIRLTHAELIARLDRADPAGWSGTGAGRRVHAFGAAAASEPAARPRRAGVPPGTAGAATTLTCAAARRTRTPVETTGGLV